MSAVGARGLETLDDAQAYIAELIQECKSGLSDHEAEALEVAQAWELDEDWVMNAFVDARLTARLAKQEREKLDVAKRMEDALKAKGTAQAASPKADPPKPISLAQKPIRNPFTDKSEPVEPSHEPKRLIIAKPVVAKPAPPKPTIPPAPLPPADADEFTKLCYPPGLLGHVTQYMMDTARLPHRGLCLAGAISACAKGIDRKVIGPSDFSVVLFILLLAETGAGKQHILNCIRIILRAMDEEDAIAASALASLQAIEEILEGQPPHYTDGKPSALITIDEVGSWLARISSRGQTGNVSEIPSTLQSLWGWPPDLEWVGTKKKGKEMKKVYGPAFSIFGASTEDAFYRTLKQKDLSSGFVNRMLVFDIGQGAEIPVDPKYSWSKLPGWLHKSLKEVAGEKAHHGPQKLAMPAKDGVDEVVLRDFRRLTWGAGAKELWRAFEIHVRSMPSVDDREIWVRTPDMAVRLATVLAVFCGRLVVTVEDWTWARSLVEHCMRGFLTGLEEYGRRELGQTEATEELRKEFRRQGELTQGQIRKFLERRLDDLRKIDPIIIHLEQCHDIEELPRSSGAGRPTRKWRWIKHPSKVKNNIGTK